MKKQTQAQIKAEIKKHEKDAIKRDGVKAYERIAFSLMR